MIYTSKNTYVKFLFRCISMKAAQCGNKEQGVYRGKKLAKDKVNKKAG